MNRIKKQFNRGDDPDFTYVLVINPALEQWRALAAEWFAGRRRTRYVRKHSMDKFLLKYLHPLKLEMNPYLFLLKSYRPPSFWETCGYDSAQAVISNNHISEFLDWVLEEKLSVEDDHGHKVAPAKYWNPVPKRSYLVARHIETYRTPLPYRYIRELQSILCQGHDFRDWTWVQEVIPNDWFEVDAAMVGKTDPDCVWRERQANIYRYTEKSRYAASQKIIYEIWSPVRAVALYVKLMLPLRTHQVRMLDSGEADTWRYHKGQWLPNGSPLAAGSEKRPYMRGVFHRGIDQKSGKIVTALYINTNKTADINKDEKDKGYVIPWQNDRLLYWLEKLRNWQSRYNPLIEPTPWTKIRSKHDPGLPHEEILKSRGTACFLFRHAAAKDPRDRILPLPRHNIRVIWINLLSELERRCKAREEKLEDGSGIEFVIPKSVKKPYSGSTHYPLHNLRVSLITAYALEGGVEFQILSKLIAGHSRLIMTLYYTKAGVVHVTEVMNNAERALLEKDKESYRRFLGNATFQQIEDRFAINDPATLLAVSQQKTAAGFVFEDKGICSMSCSGCNIGGEDIIKWPGRYRINAPVIGYPIEKNCIRCRFFLTGPAFLPGLIAHFNSISFQLTECSTRYMHFEQQVEELEVLRYEGETAGRPFTMAKELERICHLHEQEAEKTDKLANDLQATLRLIDRCTQLLKSSESQGIKLVPVGTVSDVGYALEETQSELRQIEMLCENAEFYPEIDVSKAALRRSQILDAMLELNGKSPLLFKLTPEQQLLVGNHLMNLIRCRVGDLKNAVSVAEGMVTLKEIGLLNETVELIEQESGLPVLTGSIINVDSRKSIPENRKGIPLRRILDDPEKRRNRYDPHRSA